MANDDFPITEDIFFPFRQALMPSPAVTEARRLRANKQA